MSGIQQISVWALRPMLNLASVLHYVSLTGVNHTIPGNGGEECLQYLPQWQKITETLLFGPVCFYIIKRTVNSLDAIDGNSKGAEVKKILAAKFPLSRIRPLPSRDLVFFTYLMVFSIELLYKIVTRTMIFLFNPCHVCTFLQLILLRMPLNNPTTTKLFRFQMYTVPGALIAIFFPILNTRLMTGEVFIYFVQHIFIVLVPLYLISLEGGYSAESPSNVVWPAFSMSVLVLYHFFVLQPIAQVTHVNLNAIMCPAISDPFAGRFYRLCAVSHQCLIVPLVTKLYGFSSYYVALVIELCTQKPKLK